VLPSDGSAAEQTVSNLPMRPHIARGDLGLTLAPLTDDARARLGMPAQQPGVMVEDVVANSTAWERGITSGSAIVMVDRQPATSPANVLKSLQEAENGNHSFVLLLVEGTHGLRWIPLPLSPGR
jgi:serine protease Do